MRATYEYKFECDESPSGFTWQSCRWIRVGLERSLVEWKVEAYYECPHCGEKHTDVTYAPATEEDLLH